MLHHVEIYVSDLSKSKNFWGWLLPELGYEAYQNWESGVSWKYENTYLVFVQVEERFKDIPYHRRRVGLNHLAFYASSRKQVDILAGTLLEKGVNVLYRSQHPHAGGDNHYAVYFEDPDRIRVEIVAPE